MFYYNLKEKLNYNEIKKKKSQIYRKTYKTVCTVNFPNRLSQGKIDYESLCRIILGTEGSPVPFTSAISNHGRDKNCNATIQITDNTHQQGGQQVAATPPVQGQFASAISRASLNHDREDVRMSFNFIVDKSIDALF